MRYKWEDKQDEEGEARKKEENADTVTSDYPKLFIEHIFVLRLSAVSCLRAALLLLIKASGLGGKKTILSHEAGVGST